MKDIYILDYPNISLELFDYEDMTLYFNEDIWNLVIEFDEDEERYFISNDNLSTYVDGSDMEELIEDLKEKEFMVMSVYSMTPPDDNLTKDAIDLKKSAQRKHFYKLQREKTQNEKLLLAVVALISLVGCSADPEARTAKEWVREALIEDYVGDDEVVFHFEEDYEIYAGGENFGNYTEWEGSYIAFLTVEVYDFDGFNKKYYAFIVWEDDGNIFIDLFTKPKNRKISDEYIMDLDIIEQ